MPVWARIAAGLLLLLFVGQGIAFLRANSQTSDESFHLLAGYTYVERGEFHLNVEHPPLIKQLGGWAVKLRYGLELPPGHVPAREVGRAGVRFLYQSDASFEGILTAARLPNLLLGTLLVVAIGCWAWRIWGWQAGLVGLALAAFEPNLVAHSSLLTTDTGLALFWLLVFWLAWEHAKEPSWARLVGVGVAMGLAFATKFSAVALPGVLGLAVLAWVLAGGSFPLRPSVRPASLGGRLLEAFLAGTLVVVVALAIVPPFYGFEDYRYWLKGVERVLGHMETGHATYLLGEYGTEGWPHYFLVAFLVKTPVGTLLLVLAGLLFFRAGRPLERREALFVVLPALIYLALVSRARLAIGVRHLLPMYPLLFVAASRLATVRFRRAWLAPALIAVALAATALSSLRVAPHQIAYFNELVGGPARGHLYLNDSNLDWGQDLGNLASWLREENAGTIYLGYFGNAPPEAFGIEYQALPSFGPVFAWPDTVVPTDQPRRLLAISTFTLMGLRLPEHDAYKWLFEREPVTRIGWSIWVFDITGDAEAHRRIAEVYRKVGREDLAARTLEAVR